MRWLVELEEDEITNDWAVWCPELPGCASAGKTLAEALANIDEAISLYLETDTYDLAWSFANLVSVHVSDCHGNRAVSASSNPAGRTVYIKNPSRRIERRSLQNHNYRQRGWRSLPTHSLECRRLG